MRDWKRLGAVIPVVGMLTVCTALHVSCAPARNDGRIEITFAGLDRSAVELLVISLDHDSDRMQWRIDLADVFDDRVALEDVRAGTYVAMIAGRTAHDADVQKGTTRSFAVESDKTASIVAYMADIEYELCEFGEVRCAYAAGLPPFLEACVGGNRFEIHGLCGESDQCDNGRCVPSEVFDDDIDACGVPLTVTCAPGGQCLPVLPTGLTTCQEPLKGVIACPGNAGSETCGATPLCGQDAQYPSLPRDPLRVGSAAGDTFVCDPATTLVWQKSFATLLTWQEGIDACDRLEYGGRDDWRMPTVAELRTVIDNGRASPRFDTTVFDSIVTEPASEDDLYVGSFWSRDPLIIDDDRAWTWKASGGDTKAVDKNEPLNVMCVRGGPEVLTIESPYISETNESGQILVRDITTRLNWTGTADFSCPWTNALAYCEELVYAGHDDWRLPNLNELMTLSNIRQFNPATLFPDAPSNWFWSSTPLIGAPKFARIVNLKDYGEASSVYATQSSSAHVYCVRGPGELSCTGETCADASTGLMWQRSLSTKITRADAQEACAALNLDNQTGWRIPTIDELRTLIRGCSHTAADGACRVSETCRLDGCRDTSCSGCEEDAGPAVNGCYWDDGLMGGCRNWFWSSTEYTNNPTSRWIVDFSTGRVNHCGSSDLIAARCVRAIDTTADTSDKVDTGE